MDVRARYGFLMGLGGCFATSVATAQTAADSLPTGVTAAMVAAGKRLFLGEGLCLACHGPDGKGVIGPDLTDANWLRGTGDYSEIVSQILKGVDASESKSGQIMPPLGGSSLNDDQVRAVAAYVWWMSHRQRKPGERP